MSEINKIKNPSPLVQSVIALDTYFSELIRLGSRIEEMELKSDFDFEQVQRLMNHFAECGQGVSEQIVTMSAALNESRAKAEAAAQVVAERAGQLQVRKDDVQAKMDELRQLGDNVRELTLSLSELKKPEGETVSEDDRAKISMRLSEFDLQLRPLIEKAQQLKETGQNARMKVLEQSADSLRQSLLAISQKLSTFQATGQSSH